MGEGLCSPQSSRLLILAMKHCGNNNYNSSSRRLQFDVEWHDTSLLTSYTEGFQILSGQTEVQS